MARVLALDVGTSSARAQVFDGDGSPLEGTDRKCEYAGETDPARIAELARGALDAARSAVAVDAVAASCFGHSLVAVDARGRPLTPVLGWRDTRSAAAADWLSRRLDPGAVHARTGCHLHTSYWPAKLAWLATEDPELFRSAARFVSFPEFVYSQFAGAQPAMSPSMASGTGLIDLDDGGWDEELLATLALGPERLPQLGDEPVGDREPWFPAVFDGACSNVGAGCLGRTRANLGIGTSAALRTVYETERPLPRPGLFLYRVDARRVVEGGALSDGGNVYGWLEATVRDPDGSLAGRDPDSHGLTFLALLGGERSPGWRDDARGAVAGLTFATTPLDLLQAALEGVAFRIAEVVDLMPEVDEIVVTGGAPAHNPDWCQIVADGLAREVALSSVAEASLRGAAVLALERLGEAPPPPAVARHFEPRPERAEAYRAARERQRRLYDAVT